MNENYNNQPGGNYAQYNPPQNGGYSPDDNRFNGGYGRGNDNYPQNNRDSNKTVIIVVIIALVIILALGGVITFMLLSKNPSDSEKLPMTTTAAATAATEAKTEPATISVINVEGYKSDDAYQALNDAGIKYTVSREYSEKVDEGYVISQSPKSGSIKADEKVKLYVSKGSEKAKQSSQSSQSSENTRTIYINNGGDSSYIIADSNSRYLSESEVRSLSRDQMNYAINEIYARHGRLFKSSSLQSYFNSKSWYHGYVEPGSFDANVNSYLNNVEIYNVNLIDKVQKQLGYK